MLDTNGLHIVGSDIHPAIAADFHPTETADLLTDNDRDAMADGLMRLWNELFPVCNCNPERYAGIHSVYCPVAN